MLVFVIALAGAAANASSSVLQRKANRNLPDDQNLSWRLIRSLLHRPVWFAGILAIIAGFLLQAAALSQGALATVEPIFIVELPMTLLIGWQVFHRAPSLRAWMAIVGMTLGLGALLYLLSPTGGSGDRLPATVWILAVGLTVATIVALVAAAHITKSQPRRSAVLGVAAGFGFGLTASLIKAMTDVLANGFVALLTTWPLYAVAAAGVGAMFLLQSAFNAGPLVTVQPGVTLGDPIVSVAWGIAVFGEQVQTGLILIASAFAALVTAGSVVVLARSSDT